MGVIPITHLKISYITVEFEKLNIMQVFKTVGLISMLQIF